jgi:hypothetical protein
MRPADEIAPTISLDTAARWLGLSYESARRRAVAGRFPGAFQIGRVWRVSRRAILREIERLAGLNTHEPVIPHTRHGAPRNPPARAHVPAAALKGSQRLSQVKRGTFIAASEPAPLAADEPSLVHKRGPRS